MSIMLTDEGASLVLTKFFNGTVPANGLGLTNANNLLLKLYINNITPSDTDIVSAYTEITDGDGGYADKELIAANFVVSIVSNIAQAAYAQQNFTFTSALTAGATVYGYYIVNSDGALIYAERAAVAFTPIAPGDAILFTPVFQLSKGTPT